METSAAETDHDRQARSRELHVDQQVMARNLRPGVPWVAGVIIERLGPSTYLVQVDTGQLWKRHLDHLRVRGDQLVSGQHTQPQDSEWNFAKSPEPPPPLETSRGPNAPTTSSGAQPINHHYPQRQRQAPNRYM